MTEQHMYALGHLDEIDPWGSNADKNAVARGFVTYAQQPINLWVPIDEVWREYVRQLKAMAARQQAED